MEFTVREVHSDHIVVDFVDGSWAQVPYKEDINGDKNKLVAEIMSYAPKPVVSWVNQIPLEAGETITHNLILEAGVETGDEPSVLTWEMMRAELYPSVKDQLDAMYWATQGRPELLQEVTDAITEVKRVIPKGTPNMTPEGLHYYLMEQ